MKTISKLVGAASLLAMSAGASALTVDNITWNEAYGLDFSSLSQAIYQNISAPGGNLSGYGIITAMNGLSNFTAAGYELTYQYNGFTPVVAGSLPSAPGQTIEYSGGVVDIFVHLATGTINIADPLSLTLGNTGQNGGDLWLSLAGHGLGVNNVSLIGNVVADLSGNIGTLAGGGQLDITGGAAGAYFNSNLKAGGSDFSFTSSFSSYLPNNNPPSATDIRNAYGTANFAGKTVIPVPEPGSLALIGLGLLGFGAMRRKAV